MRSYEPYSLTVDPDDGNYDDWTLTRVSESDECWEVSGDGGISCLVPRLRERAMVPDAGGDSPAPQVGDTLRVYGHLGQEIQGQVLNGTVLWYRTPAQREMRRRRDLEDLYAQRDRRFTIEQTYLDMRYARLPKPFQARLDRFRAEKPTFREESESYESFCLEQAAILANYFGDVDAITAWAALPSDEQEDPPGFEGGQHSGNTFGASIAFAKALLRGDPV